MRALFLKVTWPITRANASLAMRLNQKIYDVAVSVF